MVNEWRTTTLGEFSPFTYGKSLPARDRSENGEILVYGSGGKSGKHNKAHVNEAGIIVGRKGTVGSVLFSENPFWPIDTTFYITRKEGQDLKFTYYLLKTLRLNEMNADSAVPGLNRDEAHSISFELPPYSEQKKIADVLGSIDNKIQLNRETNQTLEAMAQALFKSWFVDFDPVFDNIIAHNLAHNNAPLHNIPEPLLPHAQRRLNAHSVGRGSARQTAAHAFHHLFPQAFEQSDEPSVGIQGWIPKGWGASNVGATCDVTMGQSPPGSTYNEKGIGLPFFQGKTDYGFRFPKNRIYCTEPKRVANKSDTLISVRAPVGDVNMAKEKCILGRGVAAARHKSGAISYTYYLMKELESFFKVFESEGTVFGSINQKDFKALSVIDAPKKITETFELLSQRFDNKLELITENINSLESLRDTLLPKLISGELRIPDAEQASEALAK